MNTVTIRLVCPHEGKFVAMGDFTNGGGFRWVEVAYSVNPVGSTHLYEIHSAKRDGVEVDVEAVKRLNPPDAVDEAIAMKLHGEYQKKVQLEKPKKKPKPKPVIPEDPGQHVMKFSLP
jgi:hypothetical protein